MSCGCGPRCAPDLDPRDEGPSEEDLERFGAYDRACPTCGADVYHDAAMCPACGHAIRETTGSGTKTWVAVTALVATVAFVLVFVL